MGRVNTRDSATAKTRPAAGFSAPAPRLNNKLQLPQPLGRSGGTQLGTTNNARGSNPSGRTARALQQQWPLVSKSANHTSSQSPNGGGDDKATPIDPEALPPAPNGVITTGEGLGALLRKWRERNRESKRIRPDMTLGKEIDSIYFKNGDRIYRMNGADLPNAVTSIATEHNGYGTKRFREEYYYSLMKLGNMYLVKDDQLVAKLHPLAMVQALTLPNDDEPTAANLELALSEEKAAGFVSHGDRNYQLQIANLNEDDLHAFFARRMDKYIQHGRKINQEPSPWRKSMQLRNRNFEDAANYVEEYPDLKLSVVAKKFHINSETVLSDYIASRNLEKAVQYLQDHPGSDVSDVVKMFKISSEMVLSSYLATRNRGRGRGGPEAD